MASDVGDVAVRLSDNLYEGRGGKATASELSSQVAGLMESADFSPGSPIYQSFKDTAAANNLLNDLVLVEFDAIDGLTPTGEVDGNGRLDLAEVQTAIQLGTNDIYMKTALSYLEDTLGKYVDPQGMSINDFKLLVAMQPAKDPTGTLVAPETGIDYFAFNGAEDPIALLGNAPPIAKQFSRLDGDGNGGVSGIELEAAVNSDDDEVRNAAMLAYQSNVAWNEDGTPREFTFDDVIADARNRGVLPPEPIFTEPSVETPAVPTDAPADPTVAPTDVEADCTAILNDPAKSTVEQLAAIKKLVDNGITTATLKDADGNPISVRLEVVSIAGSDRTMVHMFAIDPTTGQQTVVLRAINDGENWSKQRDQNGNEVEFVGTRWKRNNAGTHFGD